MSSGVSNPWEGTNIPEDFYIPPCGIEDIDRALFYLFDRRLAFSIDVNNVPKKVPVVFSTGERFALNRREPPIRDRNNALILPIIAVKRNSINFDAALQGVGSAIANRDQDGYIIRRKLSKKDRNYQNLVNKLRLKNQDNVANRKNFSASDIFPGNRNLPGTVASRRNGNNLSYRDDPSGKLLRPDIGQNIFEVIQVPYPKFILANYEVTFWTQYTVHMNQLLESLVSQFDGQEKGFSIKTDAGYEFVAMFKGEFSPENNFNDFSSDERIIRYSFSVQVPGFILAPRNPGMPLPYRRYYTAPHIEFGIKQISTHAGSPSRSEATGEEIGGEERTKRFILSDIEDMNKNGNEPLHRGQTGTELFSVIENPFTGEKSTSFSRVRTRLQRSGETVASANIVVNLETQNDDIQD